MAKETSGPTTSFVVQPFRIGKRGALAPGEQRTARSRDDAKRLGLSMLVKASGVIAFEVEVDRANDFYGEPDVFFTAGRVPEMA